MCRNTDRAIFSDPATLDFYDAEAPAYLASDKGGVSRWLDDFIGALPKGARILELGCGGGRDAAAMLARGFDVHPTDGSPEMAARAQEKLGRPVRTMLFHQLSEVDAYDAVWASASLLHVPRAGLSGVLRLVFAALKPGGLHFASYKGGGIAGRDVFGRYYNYPDRQTLISAYGASGPWEMVSAVEYVDGGYDGSQGPWTAISARRPAA